MIIIPDHSHNIFMSIIRCLELHLGHIRNYNSDIVLYWTNRNCMQIFNVYF